MTTMRRKSNGELVEVQEVFLDSTTKSPTALVYSYEKEKWNLVPMSRLEPYDSPAQHLKIRGWLWETSDKRLFTDYNEALEHERSAEWKDNM